MDPVVEPLVLALLKHHIGIQPVTTRDTGNRRALDHRLGHNLPQEIVRVVPRASLPAHRMVSTAFLRTLSAIDQFRQVGFTGRLRLRMHFDFLRSAHLPGTGGTSG